MRKTVSILLAAMLALVSCAAFAEGIDPEQFAGKWFVNRVTIDGVTWDTSETADKTVFEFNAGGTGFIYAMSDAQCREFGWTADGNAVEITETVDGTPVAAKMAPEGDGLAVCYEDKTYLLEKTAEFNTELRRGLYAEFDCDAPEGSGQETETLTGAAMEIIASRLKDKGYEGANVWPAVNGGIRVEIPDVQGEAVLELVSAPGALEFVDPDGKVFMTNEMIESANYVYLEGDHAVAFTLTEEGAKLFAEATAANTGKTITIRLDGKTLVAATVRTAITNGSGLINGMGNADRATTTAAQITAPRLPVEMTLRKAVTVMDVRGAEEAAADARERAKDGNTVILKYGDREITKDEVQAKTREKLDYNKNLFEIVGADYDVTDPKNIADAQAAAVHDLKAEMVKAAKAAEAGLDRLTEEDMEIVRTEAQKDYDACLDYVIKLILTDTEGMDEEALTRAAAEKAAELGITLEGLTERAREDRIEEKLRLRYTWSVEVTDGEVDAEVARRTKEGAASDADVREAVRRELLESKQKTVFEQIVGVWILEAGIEENPDALD